MLKKISLILLLIFITFIFAIVFICPRLINTDNVKKRITKNIHQKYNYDIRFDSIKFSLFFGIKTKLENIEAKSLGEEDKYSVDVKAKALKASIKLIPLFHRRLIHLCGNTKR